MLQRWLGTVLLYCEQQIKRVKCFAEIAQSWRPSKLSTRSRSPLRQRRLRETIMGAAQKIATNILTTPAMTNAGFFRKRVYDKIGLYETRFGIAADREFLIRATVAGIESIGIQTVSVSLSGSLWVIDV